MHGGVSLLKMLFPYNFSLWDYANVLNIQKLRLT